MPGSAATTSRTRVSATVGVCSPTAPLALSCAMSRVSAVLCHSGRPFALYSRSRPRLLVSAAASTSLTSTQVTALLVRTSVTARISPSRCA